MKKTDFLESDNAVNVVQEKNYGILKNFSGQLVFVLSSLSKYPSFPKVVYDGGSHAVLYRDGRNIKILDYLNENVREDILDCSEIRVVELDEEKKIKHEYLADVIISQKVLFDKGNFVDEKDMSMDEKKEFIKEFVSQAN